MIKLLIADDNTNFVKSLVNNVIGKNDNIKLVKIATDGEEAINFIKEHKPDIIILDIVMPKISGIEILQEIEKEKEEYMPYIIVITGVPDCIPKITNKELVYSFYLKPVIMQNLEQALENINSFYEEKNIKKFIKMELKKYNFKNTSIAYQYLEEAIYMSIINPKLLKNMEKDLFSIISKKYPNTTFINIKWSIEKLVKSTYKYTNEDMSTKSFIYYIVEKYKTENSA